jgi:hypothetical protein
VSFFIMQRRIIFPYISSLTPVSLIMRARLMTLQLRRMSACGASAGGNGKAKRNILDLSFEDLAGEMVKLGQPSYRSRQLWTYIYGKLGTSFEHVPSFPSSLKQQVILKLQVSCCEDTQLTIFVAHVHCIL